MKKRELVKIILAIMIVFSFFALLIILLFRWEYQEAKDILNLVVGALIGAFSTIVGFYFGSSHKEDNRDEKD